MRVSSLNVAMVTVRGRELADIMETIKVGA